MSRKYTTLLLAILAILFLGFTPQTTTVDASWKTVCEQNASEYPNVTFHVHNTGLTNPFTACRVQVFIGPLATDWEDVTINWTACNSLAAGASSTWSITGSSYSKFRMQVQSTIGTTCYCRPYATR